VVSPNYAREILLPSNLERGYFGGEGLDDDLRRADDEGRLYGILNGCEYPQKSFPSLSVHELLLLCEKEQLNWIGSIPLVESSHLIASKRLAQMLEEITQTSTDSKNKVSNKVNNKTKNQPQKPLFIVTSVGRITHQKIRLLQQVMPNGETALDHLLSVLGDKGILIMLGTGSPELEQFLTVVSKRQKNFIYLKGYSEILSQSLYCSGDLFLMPSSFEPCGISQMLAMRAGQPCLVHGVGGLNDTVEDGKNGFVFTGVGETKQAENMISRFKSVLKLTQKTPKDWKKISTAASKVRFLWSDVANQYNKFLYKQ
jgi:starch synthase